MNPAQAALGVLDRWQGELQDMSPRKFLRVYLKEKRTMGLPYCKMI